MAIPELTELGLLPGGLFDCTIEELGTRFGGFLGSDRRPRLFARLCDMLSEMRRSELFVALVVDGSFVTARAAPNDIDLIAILKNGHDFERDLPISEYALISRTLLRRRFGFDVVVAEADSHLYNTYMEFFSRVREFPERRKGMLRLSL